MNAYDFVHLVLNAMGGQIQGRTKLQKTIYFLGILTGNIDELGYRPHYYGPYSDAVAAAVNRLKALGFVEEGSLHTGMLGKDGFEIARHDFTLTEEGKAISAKKAEVNAPAWKKITEAVAKFRRAGDVDYMKMSVAAKTYFVLSNKGQPTTVVELSESAKALGWNPKPAEIMESVKFLEDLGLAMSGSK